MIRRRRCRPSRPTPAARRFLDSNDLALGIRQAQEDIRSYYIIGYYSSNAAADGKYRRVQIKLASNTQAKLDYRKGYYAGKTFSKFTSADKERQLEEALTLGDPVSELPLALEVDYFRVAKDRYFIPISVKLPGSSHRVFEEGRESRPTRSTSSGKCAIRTAGVWSAACAIRSPSSSTKRMPRKSTAATCSTTADSRWPPVTTA